MDSVTTNGSPRRRGARGAAGFTLIEAIIGMCVMMVVGLGAGSLFIYSINFNSGASDRARALALAQQRMEVLRAADYDDLETAIAATGFTGAVAVGSRTAGESDERTFNVTATVTENATIKLKTVTLTVTPVNSRRWTGGVALRTLRAAPTTGTN